MQWPGAATIGFNAVDGMVYANHPFSGTSDADFIDCVNMPESVWNNVIYDLAPEFYIGRSNITASPPPYGSCVLNSFIECCDRINPLLCTPQNPPDCFCDGACFKLGDCCSDINQTCQNYGTYVCIYPSNNDIFLKIDYLQCYSTNVLG